MLEGKNHEMIQKVPSDGEESGAGLLFRRVTILKGHYSEKKNSVVTETLTTNS